MNTSYMNLADGPYREVNVDTASIDFAHDKLNEVAMRIQVEAVKAN